MPQFFKRKMHLNESQSSVTRLSKVSIAEKVYYSESQSAQDIFVQIAFPDKKIGCYLEIGSGRPVNLSNTYILEKIHNWKGISIDIDSEMIELFNQSRINKAYCSNGTAVDYKAFVREKGFDGTFDYLSVDIDPAYQSYFALKRILLCEIKFSTLTFEHDKYRSGAWVQILSSKLLKKFGYIRISKDIRSAGFGKYEDWWIFDSHFTRSEKIEIQQKIQQLRIMLKI
jgi:hypothetical protein